MLHGVDNTEVGNTVVVTTTRIDRFLVNRCVHTAALCARG